MSKQISILAGLKNNLEYTKLFYSTTRLLYPEVEIVLVSHNSTDGTHEWLDSLHDQNLLYYYDTEDKTFSDTFNRCATLATKKYVLFAHNDMVLAPHFLENIEKVLDEKTIIIYSTVEPPIFADHERDGKIIRDFGQDLSSMNVAAFYEFSSSFTKDLKTTAVETTAGSFFMCLHRQTLLGIGGLDPLFNPMFREDDDLLIRLKLLGMKICIALDAICYHFVSKTSRFSDEYQHKTRAIEANSHRNFIRKWGFSNTSLIQKRYDVGFVLKNATMELVALIEPWCSCIYIDFDPAEYIKVEQSRTSLVLKDRVRNGTAKPHDIMIFADGRSVKGKVLSRVQQLNEEIYKKLNKRPGFFKRLLSLIYNYDALRVQVHTDRSFENELINRKSLSDDLV